MYFTLSDIGYLYSKKNIWIVSLLLFLVNKLCGIRSVHRVVYGTRFSILGSKACHCCIS